MSTKKRKVLVLSVLAAVVLIGAGVLVYCFYWVPHQFARWTPVKQSKSSDMPQAATEVTIQLDEGENITVATDKLTLCICPKQFEIIYTDDLAIFYRFLGSWYRTNGSEVRQLNGVPDPRFEVSLDAGKETLVVLDVSGLFPLPGTYRLYLDELGYYELEVSS